MNGFTFTGSTDTRGGTASTRGGGSNYDPYNLPVTGGYGYGPDPFGESGSARNIATGAAEANLVAAPDMARLSELVNAINRAAQQAANMSRIPGEANLEALSSVNIERGLQGLVDPTTEAMLRSNIAAQYGRGGFGVDTPALSSAYHRALGLDIAALQEQAQKDLTAAVARNPAAPIVDASSFLVNPQTYAAAAADQARRQLEQERIAQEAYQFEQKQRESLRRATMPLGFDVTGALIPGGEYPTVYVDRFGKVSTRP